MDSDTEWDDSASRSTTTSSQHTVKRSSIQRDRAVATNPEPPKRQRQQTIRGKNNVKTVSVAERILAFPREYFEYRTGQLYCGACSEFVSTKLTTLKTHVRTMKHVAGKKRLECSKVKQTSIAHALKEQDKAAHAVGEMLPEEQRVFRTEVVESFLTGGIPLQKIDHLRRLLEHGRYRLTSSSNMAQLIPVIHRMEMKRLREELCVPGQGEPPSTMPLSVIFDGSTRLGEAIAIIVRYLDAQWVIQQRLLRLDVVAKSVTAQDLCQVLVECLFTRYSIQGAQVVAMMRDGVAVNGAAVRHLGVFMPNAMNIVCFSHTIDNVGKRFNTPTLDAFGQHWIRLFSTSCRAKLQWKDQTGQSPKTYSETRWWSRWEVYNQMLTYFGELRRFLDDNQDVAPKTMDHLRVVMNDPDQVCRLKLELAAVIDVGKHFVTATYDLEGDGALVLCCYERLQAVAYACRIHAMHLPNVRAVARDLAASNPEVTVEWAEEHGRESIRDAVLWFSRKFNVELYDTVRVFKIARLMCPETVNSLQPTPATLNQLRIIKVLDSDAIIEGLVDELPLYLAAATDVTFLGETMHEVAGKKLGWWRDHADQLPLWSNAVRKVILIQPSSAAAERVFSIMKAAFGHLQANALTDYLECSLMLQYNKR